MHRVIQWATGTVGRHAIRAICASSDLTLVGAYVYSPDKAGRDVGDICGIGSIGVRATNDKAAICALPADCVLYMSQGEDDPQGTIENICLLLASGKNVISTALTALIYPRAAGEEVVARLQAACRAGNTSFHGTGIQPGWAAEVLPLTLSCLFRRIDSLLVREIFDYSTYPSARMLFDTMGFGKPPRPHPPLTLKPGEGAAFVAPLMLLADALGANIERVIYACEFAVAATALEITAGRIEVGTVAGKRYSFTAMIDGRPAICIEHVTRLGDEVAPGWPTGRGWHVAIDGAPSMRLQSQIAVAGEDANDQACLGTAMHAVHAVRPVCAAAPGIRTFLDLPIIAGRGVLSGRPG